MAQNRVDVAPSATERVLGRMPLFLDGKGGSVGVGFGGRVWGFGGGEGKIRPPLQLLSMMKKETEETKQAGKKKATRKGTWGVILPAYHTPHQRAEKTRVGRQQVRGHDARLDAVGGYAGAVVAVVDPARVDDGGDFRVPVAFPRDRFLSVSFAC